MQHGRKHLVSWTACKLCSVSFIVAIVAIVDCISFKHATIILDQIFRKCKIITICYDSL